MRFLPVEFLRGNEVLAMDIYNDNMQVLLSEGTLLTEMMIKRLIINGVQSVYITDPVPRTTSDRMTDDDFLLNQTPFEKYLAKKKQVSKKNIDDPLSEETFLKEKNMATHLLKSIMVMKKYRELFNTLRAISEYHYHHSFNVAQMSLILSAHLNLKDFDLEALSMSALFADIGHKYSDDRLMYKMGTFSDEERALIQEHVMDSCRYIEQSTDLDVHVKSIILHHHERMDGSGYPKGLKSKDIHPLSKILMIADVYDALTSDRSYREAYSETEAMEYIIAHAGSLFDYEHAKNFMQKMIIYPSGTYVLLSNGQKGVVSKNNPGYPLRPIIRTFGISNYTNTSTFQIDLLHHKNITIVKKIPTLN